MNQRIQKPIFTQELFVGFVSKVTPDSISVHIPSSKYITRFLSDGENYHGGILNTYLVIESEEIGFIGKVLSTEIPEKERLELSNYNMGSKELHPLMKVEIQAMFDYYSLKFNKSISDFPNVGAKVYLARKEVVDSFIKQLEVNGSSNIKTRDFACIVSDNTVKVDVSLQSLLSRHMAIIGTTGGGKSWTTAKIIENVVENNQKVIVLDATGEYKPLAEFYYLLGQSVKVTLGETHELSYKNLMIDDLFYLTEPSEKSQKPKLLEAIRSLKLLERCSEELGGVGGRSYLYNAAGVNLLKKENNEREYLLQLIANNYEQINSSDLNFNIKALSLQVENECIWETGRPNTVFGGKDATSLGYNVSLIGRINNILANATFNSIFNFNNEDHKFDLLRTIDDFNNGDENLLWIDLSNITFQYNIREIVVNIIGERLLSNARSKLYIDNPMVVLLDEAHQFLQKKLSSDFDTYRLEAFDNIAKEGRKYGLFLGITTQMPRDIPIGTLSQIGTFIVHRLISYRDKETITNALSSANRDVLSYLPELGAGEAIVSSIELKLPLLVKINEPDVKPNSNTPYFKSRNSE